VSLAQDMRSRMGASVPSQHEETATRVSIWKFAATPLVVGAALRLLTVAFVQVLHGNFLFLDDQGDDQIGWAFAQAWHMGRFPSPQSVAITNSYLYYLFVAVVYFAFGRHWILIKVLAALLSALSVPAAAAIGNSLAGRRLGLRAAWLAAIYPNAIFWGSTGLKDGPMATLLLAVAAVALRPLTMRRLACAVALLVVAFLSRPVEGAIGLAMLAVPAAELTRRRWNSSGYSVRTGTRLLVLLLGIPAASVVLLSQAIRYLPTLQASLAGQPTLSLSTGPVSINFVPSPFDLAYALLSPVRWFGPATDSAYIPGMLVWTLLLPAIALGCWKLLRHQSRAAKGVVISALIYMYLYTCVFQGQGFSRQRFTVEILFLVIGLYAFERAPQVAATCTALCACVAAPAQLFLSGVLRASGVAIFVIAVSAVWFGADLRRTWRFRRSAIRPRALTETRTK
jgi:hypothetical protein